jgi:hypothetical protein
MKNQKYRGHVWMPNTIKISTVTVDEVTNCLTVEWTGDPKKNYGFITSLVRHAMSTAMHEQQPPTNP